MLIITTKGEVDDSLLDKTEGYINNDNEETTWQEWRFKGQDEIVKREVQIRLKKSLFMDGVASAF